MDIESTFSFVVIVSVVDNVDIVIVVSIVSNVSSNLFMLSFSSMLKIYKNCSIEALHCCLKTKN